MVTFKLIEKVKKNKTKSVQFPYTVKDTEVTLQQIHQNKKSISRFGDGEFQLVFNKSIGFQNKDKKLRNMLRNILIDYLDNPNCLVAIPSSFNLSSEFSDESLQWWSKYLLSNQNKILKYLSPSVTYFDAQITRIYINRRDKIKSQFYFDYWRSIWNNKKVLIVEGNKTRLGYHNDLFSNTSLINRIECPSDNAFEKYNDIYDTVINIAPNYDIVLLSLGPTATILAYELSMKDLWAIDFGNMDMEYEWFKSKADHRVPVQGKYTLEVNGGTEVEDIYDESFNKEILYKIG